MINVTIMNIESTKLELMQLLLQTQKESLLEKIKTVFEEEPDWWSEMSKEEQEDIQVGLAEADQGNYIPNETVMKRFDKWH